MDINRFFLFISYKQIEEFQNSWSRASDDFEKRQAQKWSICHEMKANIYIDWNLGLWYDHRVWPDGDIGTLSTRPVVKRHLFLSLNIFSILGFKDLAAPMMLLASVAVVPPELPPVCSCWAWEWCCYLRQWRKTVCPWKGNIRGTAVRYELATDKSLTKLEFWLNVTTSVFFPKFSISPWEELWCLAFTGCI